MSSFRERNDRPRPAAKPFAKGAKPPAKGGAGERPRDDRRAAEPKAGPAYDPAAERAPRPPARTQPRHRRGDGASEWLWGWHAVQAALANPARAGFKRLVVVAAKAGEVAAAAARLALRPEVLEPPEIARLLPSGAVHQGVALLADPLEGLPLADLAADPRGVILMLDQLTDPQNVGAIFRSAAAFGARGIVLQDRNAPALTGALAKAAVGAIDALPHARVVNLSRAMELLTEAGWRAVGLDGAATLSLEEALDGAPVVLVLGSEGEGLRRLVAEHCDALAKIPMPGGFESLNVSNAAAVALYEASRKR